jgi:hypothetical protein
MYQQHSVRHYREHDQILLSVIIPKTFKRCRFDDDEVEDECELGVGVPLCKIRECKEWKTCWIKVPNCPLTI